MNTKPVHPMSDVPPPQIPMTTHDDPVAASVARHHGDPTKLPQILRDVQAAKGFLDPDTIDAVAAALPIPRVRVESTATFYHLLHTQSHGVYEILFSDNIVDQMQGGPRDARVHLRADVARAQQGFGGRPRLRRHEPPTSASATRVRPRSSTAGRCRCSTTIAST